MENPNDTFDFKDFILSILRRWRLFLLCLLLFAFVGAGLRAFSFVRNSSEPDGKKSLSAEQYERLTNQEKMLKAQIEEQGNYLANSLYLNLDVWQLQTCEIVLTLAPRQTLSSEMDAFQLKSHTAALGDVLRGALLGDDTASAVSKALGLDEAQQRYVKELISIEYLDDTAALLLRSVYSTREGAKAIADAAYQTVTSTFSKSGAFSSAYTLEKMGESVYGTYTDESLLRRSEAETPLANLQTALTAVQEQLRTAPVTGSFSVSSCIKYGILGGAAGLLIAFLLTFLLDIMDPRLRHAGQLKKDLGLKVLGSLSKKQTKGK